MRIFPVAFALLLATPAFAQTPDQDERATIYALRDLASEAYKAGDTLEGDDWCRDLRKALDNSRYFDGSQLTGIREFVERKCPHGFSAPTPTPTPAPAPSSSYLPTDNAPANLTGDARFVWNLINNAADLVLANGDLDRTNPIRIANFRQSRQLCMSGYDRAAGAGPGAKAALQMCAAYALLSEGDTAKACREMRRGVAGLFVAGADTGPLAEWIIPYRKEVTKTLTEGPCALG